MKEDTITKINNAPARYEGPHSQLGALLREEAKRHIAIADAAAEKLIEEANVYAEEHPEMADAIAEELDKKVHDIEQDPMIRICNLESKLYGSLCTGWMRVDKDWSCVWFWNPSWPEIDPETGEPGRFELWSNELCMVWMNLVQLIEPVATAFTDGKYGTIPEVTDNHYTGGGKWGP